LKRSRTRVKFLGGSNFYGLIPIFYYYSPYIFFNLPILLFFLHLPQAFDKSSSVLFWKKWKYLTTPYYKRSLFRIAKLFAKTKLLPYLICTGHRDWNIDFCVDHFIIIGFGKLYQSNFMFQKYNIFLSFFKRFFFLEKRQSCLFYFTETLTLHPTKNISMYLKRHPS
jgi:hypothetical protein